MRSSISTDRVERRVLRVRGVVQGVGFRPFVHRLASSLGLAGTVGNDTAGVLVDVTGPPAVLDELARRLASDAPALAVVESVDLDRTVVLDHEPAAGFRIVATPNAVDGAVTALPPDVAVCDECLAEMQDPADRRYRYPFITCTGCGPRFTITRSLPYDRPNTTMAAFVLCPACRAEYEDPANRRHHAQPLACPDCGPHLALVDRTGAVLHRRDDALRAAQQMIDGGGVVAVKGIGGYHLMCDATNTAAVGALRTRKQRGAKPFAVLVADPTDIAAYASIDDAELALLWSPQRPIVLLRRTAGAPNAWPELVAPGAADVGVMLPCSPVQHLLLEGLRTRVLVCTSGNLADEPIVTDDADAVERLGAIADAWLANDRPIHSACDDSVLRVHGGAAVPVRRARGYTPLPIRLPSSTSAPAVLAMGGDLKGAVCLAAGDQAFVSQHLGDHGELATYRAARHAVEQLAQLVGVRPEVVAVDAHPAYLSSRLGRELAAAWDVPVVAVQHHHAHVASVLAEHGRLDPVIGIAFDGTGYGTDGSIWGGEVLVASAGSAVRLLHLRPVPLPGGDAAIEHPARSALAHLWAAGLPWNDALPAVRAVSAADRAVLRAQFERGTGSVATSSMGRLFDAVASLTGLRHRVDYEAQAAIELEAAADRCAPGTYAFGRPDGGAVDAAPVVAGIVTDVLAGVTAGVVSMRFHRGVAAMVVDAACRVSAAHGLRTVALSGGVFQNVLLLDACRDALTADGFEVLHHRQVPTNDGGLALGQVLVARGC